jgi:hypothetical protein
MTIKKRIANEIKKIYIRNKKIKKERERNKKRKEENI